MPIVTVLSYVRAVKDKARGVRVTLTCYNCREYGSCEKPQEAPVHLSKERSTMRACLQELQAMMKLEQANARATTANKVVLEAEKEKDAAEKAVEELKRQLQPKRARPDDDAGDAHDLLAEFDNWDLRDHRREGTRVQNRRNVQVGSRDNQQKPRPGKWPRSLGVRLYAF
jgi:hypothetical protein